MKTLLAACIILTTLISQQVCSQSKILKLNLSEEPNNWIMFPPDSKFFLTDNTKKAVLTHESDYGKFVIDKKYKLEIFTSYKQESEIYHLETGSIEIVERDSFIYKKPKKITEDKKIYKKYHSMGITATKIITDSMEKKGRKNLVLKFSNGIEFSYTDGKIGATFNGTDIYVEGKYLLYCKLGVAKVSFNPINGETWWVFENN